MLQVVSPARPSLPEIASIKPVGPTIGWEENEVDAGLGSGRLSRSARSFLDRCVWPKALTIAQRIRAFDELYEEEHRAGAQVCARNAGASSWIGVVDGFLRVQDASIDGRPIMYTGVASGGWVGEGSLLKEEPRKYEIVATRDTRTLHMPRATFVWLVNNSITFNHFMLDHLNERLGQFIGMVKGERFLQPNARVARGLASLFHPMLYPNTDPALRISQEEIAWLVGISRQRVNIAVRKLESEGVIKTGYGVIHVIDLQRLKRYDVES